MNYVRIIKVFITKRSNKASTFAHSDYITMIIISRSIALTILISIMSILTFQGCKKYEEGPVISLRSRAERVANTWKVENYKKNGTDLTSFYSDYKETYTKDGDYSYSWGAIAGTAKWKFENDDEEIQLTETKNQSNQTLVILKLEEKQFWYYYMDGEDKKEFHMTAN